MFRVKNINKNCSNKKKLLNSCIKITAFEGLL